MIWINKSVHHDHLIVILTDRQWRDSWETDRQWKDRTESETLSCLITHRTHRRHSWTYLSSREAKRKKTIAKPSLSLSKWICFCLILLTQLIFLFDCHMVKKTVILLVCVALNIGFYFGTFLGDLTIFIRK